MPHITILGGGPAGLGVAFYAHRVRVPFVLAEASGTLGGMCRTLQCGAHRYDTGAHRFHDCDPEITRDVAALLGDELVRVDAPSAIVERGRFIDFPPTPLNAVFAYGPREAGRILADLARSTLRRHRPAASFEDLAVRRFGRTLARRILLNYSAKLWGLPTDELSPDVATRRLRGMTLRTLFYELLVPGRKVEHIDGSFLYPRGGYGRIAEALAATLPPESVRTRFEIAALEHDGETVRRVRAASGETLDVPDRLVSTLPMPVLVRLLGDGVPEPARAAAARLRFRDVRLLFVRLRIDRLSSKASIYVPDPSLCVSRIYEPKNRSIAMSPPHETALVVEAPCFRGDEVARLAPEAFAARVLDELASLRLVNPRHVVEWRDHHLPNAYPVYARDYAGDVAVIREALGRFANLDTLGRAGGFVYSHLHDQLRFGRDCVRALTRAERARTA